MPNKVALRRTDNSELLVLMSYECVLGRSQHKNQSRGSFDEANTYEFDWGALVVEIIYIESPTHSNANLRSASGQKKKYIGIARVLIAYAAKISVDAGFGGVLFFKTKTDELREYYMREFGPRPYRRYDPYRLVIWEDATIWILSE